MSELKPCANCGDLFPDLVTTGAGCQIWCSSCDMQTASDDWTKDAVIKIWNKRPNFSTVEGKQLVSEKAIEWLHDNHLKIYDQFYELIDK